ncbi:MAG: GGDEF domain-containing protein [Gammaproteobacteria bacterium]|nr:GGDEF domain-containing protein [Gammaproteobacteria bacterium]MBQ0839499.1 GGDEF domain-containing protein [Gammaproteobacteria bacterium]
MQNKPIVSGATNGNGNGNGKVALLTRLAVELTRLAQGRDKKLDYLLEQLRVSLHESTPSSDFKDSAARFLKYIVSGHVEFANSFELAIKKSAIELFVAIESCFPSVTQIALLKGELMQASSLQETVEQVEKIIPLLVDISRRESGLESADAPGLLSDSPPLPDGAFSLAHVLDVVGAALNKLLDQLNLLEPDDGRIEDVRSELGRIASMDELELVLGDALSLVIVVARQIDQERQFTEQFLSQLRLHLKSLEEGIGDSIDIGASLKSVEKIQSDVGGEVSGIEAAVSENSDLDLLKQIIRTRTERLTSKVADYVEAEKKQLESAKDKIDVLTRQAQEMNAEVEGLRHQLMEKQQVLALDPLTGVANRGGFDKRIEEEMARSQRIGFPLSLLLVDIDKFKFVNDTFGHKAGDRVLQAIAKLMSGRVRDTDFIARYGGDEFVILLPGTSAEDAQAVAQGFCDAVKRCGFHSRGKSVDVTLSIGIAQLQQGDSSEAFFERADIAMYEVKNDGRDGCSIARS